MDINNNSNSLFQNENIYEPKINSYLIKKNSSDGVGFVLSRMIGSTEIDSLDPFLLYDETKPEIDDGYDRGFPMHPHRGIQLLSYTVQGSQRQKDTTGSDRHTKEGDLLLIITGSGVYHSLIPQTQNDPNNNSSSNNNNNNENNENSNKTNTDPIWHVFFWINLYAKDKMSKPETQYVEAQQVPIYRKSNITAKILCGTYQNLTSPLKPRGVIPLVLDITIQKQKTEIFQYDIESHYNSFIHIISGQLMVNNVPIPSEHNIIIFNNNQNQSTSNSKPFRIQVQPLNITDTETRFIFGNGKKTGEPIVKFGPYVMNTQQEIHQCFLDFGEHQLPTSS
ncbi:pirin family protein [Tieghemostelium lacteum]|uniref:Pirin family protein n=1 Tax=Tieghemostelium lacteum TaxID=361077 RepID=A0A151Z8B2_TIELA|nr:pirin family protein [Tieghemostelium lacteum]|eukprot:KYQ90209.1 pirin family protein [Tieghemostelium lacteum]